MPCYLIERSFDAVVELPITQIVESNADDGVTWLHSYVSRDRLRAFDLYEAPSPRRCAGRPGAPVCRST